MLTWGFFTEQIDVESQKEIFALNLFIAISLLSIFFIVWLIKRWLLHSIIIKTLILYKYLICCQKTLSEIFFILVFWWSLLTKYKWLYKISVINSVYLFMLNSEQHLNVDSHNQRLMYIRHLYCINWSYYYSKLPIARFAVYPQSPICPK